MLVLQVAYNGAQPRRLEADAVNFLRCVVGSGVSSSSGVSLRAQVTGLSIASSMSILSCSCILLSSCRCCSAVMR
jgi:hypothetical protein